MQTVPKDVKSGGNVIGQVSVPVFDNLDEAEESLGEDKILAYINRQHTVSLMDAKRQEVTGTGGGTGIRAAMKKAKDDPELMAKILALVGE